MTAPGYLATIAALTGAGRSETGIVVSVSVQLPSELKLAETAPLFTLNSASYSFAFSLPHFTSLAPGNFALKAFVTPAGTLIPWALVAAAVHTYSNSNENIFFICCTI